MYHNICFCGEIRKISVLLDLKKHLKRAMHNQETVILKFEQRNLTACRFF